MSKVQNELLANAAATIVAARMQIAATVGGGKQLTNDEVGETFAATIIALKRGLEQIGPMETLAKSDPRFGGHS
jgi:hypothetical protein